MATFTHHWRTVFLTLLLGFIASVTSMSALADVVADYSSLGCLGCHGAPPALNAGTAPFTPADMNVKYPTNQLLDKFINDAMPRTNPSLCVNSTTSTCAHSMTHYLRPLAPVADVSQSTNLSGVAPLAAHFDASLSYCDISCSSYAWNFGDNTTGSGVTTTHTYTVAGTYTATLTVTDAQSKQSSTTVTIIVSAAAMPTVANASRSSNLSGVSPLNVSFDGSLSTCNGGCSSYIWSSPDSAVFTFGVKTNEIVQLVGTHVVTLQVIDAHGLTSSTTLTVTVSASPNPPIANASDSSNLKGAAPLTVQFGDLSTCYDTCSNATWNFGDGTTDTSLPGNGITHVYTKPGTYTATLTATDAGNGKKTSTTVQVIVVPAESLTAYVSACQTQLGFPNVSIPAMNCLNGDLFDTRSPKHDYLLYKKITDQVDVAVACRWAGSPGAASIEMLIYNRQNGDTCFFSGLPRTLPNIGIPAVPINIIPPTDPTASSFWRQPADVDASVRCVGCHVSGPYIATPLIAEFLAKDGLMNNGHDTVSNTTVKYHAISATVNGAPGAFSLWDGLKQSYVDPVQSTCSQGCHMIGTLSPQPNFDINPAGNVLGNPAIQLTEILDADVMAPYDDGSDYRWINLDTPGDGVESETFAAAINATNTLVPQLFSNQNPNCAQPNVPNVMEAHVVGTENEFIVAQPGRFAFLPDKLSVFNLKDGLVCLNADQEPGTQCQDYRVHYECTDPSGNKTWTDWYNMDSPSGDGDHEERSKDANVCTSPAGSIATGIEAAITESANGWTYSSIGPNDRLAQMSPYGVICNNSDQPDGQCSNYVVRFSSCSAPPQTLSNKTLTNGNIPSSGAKQLTAATGSLTKAQGHNNAWNTQAWIIEPVKNTEYIRLHNISTNVYLTVTSTAESATVGTATSNTTTNEMWLIEPVANSSYVRLKNLFSGKYLTMGDPNSYTSTPDYIPIFSQGRNTSWNTQRWLIQ